MRSIPTISPKAQSAPHSALQSALHSTVHSALHSKMPKKRPKKRIGVLVEKRHCSVYLFRLLESLKANSSVNITAILVDPNASEDITPTRSLPWHYRLNTWIEAKVLSLFMRSMMDFCRRIDLYLDHQVLSLADATDTQFDLLFNTTSFSYSTNVLPATRDGVLSLHFGDAASGMDGPPGFLAMLNQCGATSMYLVKDGGLVFSGRYKTKRTLALNKERVTNEGFFDTNRVLKQYAETGLLPVMAPGIQPQWQSPTLPELVQLRLRSVAREVKTLVRRAVLKQEQTFSVVLSPRPWTEFFGLKEVTPGAAASNPPTVAIPNPPGCYLADPFVTQYQGKTVCFVEDYSFADQKGRIAAIDLSHGTPQNLGLVLDEPFHLSFPYVFEVGSALYMIPESFEDGRISAYRCIDFPMQWERVATVMDHVEASDTMVFVRDGRWWMLTNLRPEGTQDFYSRLYAFYSDAPLDQLPTGDDWIPHAANPIRVDSDGGRNAGLWRDSAGEIYRVGQHQGIDVYGESCSIYRVADLTPTLFTEEKTLHLTAEMAARLCTSTEGRSTSDLPTLIGTHHIHSCGEWTAFDVLSWERTTR